MGNKLHAALFIGVLTSFFLGASLGLLVKGKNITYIDKSYEYKLTVPKNWKTKEITHGREFVSFDESQRIIIKKLNDSLMTQDTLFSDQTKKNIKENYAETYKLEEDNISFSSGNISNKSCLIIDFEDKVTYDKNYKVRQFYIVENSEG